MKKKIIILLSVVMLLSGFEAIAQKLVEKVSEVVSESEFIKAEEKVAIEDEPVEKPTRVEIISEDEIQQYIEDLEKENNKDQKTQTKSNDGIALFSSSSETASLWRISLLEQFSEEYLMPLREREGEQVIGNTNRLVYRAVDLSLEGKNGLDLNVVRRLDNQNFERMHYIREGSSGERGVVLYIYAFRRQDTGEQINIGFYSKDEFYLYMSEGAYVPEFPEEPITADGYTFYDFEEMRWRKTFKEGYIFIEPISDEMLDYAGVYRKTIYSIVTRRLTTGRNDIGAGWKYELPAIDIFEDEYSRKDYDNYDSYYIDRSGIFRDINGQVHSFTSYLTYRNYGAGDIRRYLESFDSEDENISYESFYEYQQLEPYGIEYNITAYDKDSGLKYYMYSSRRTISDEPSGRVAAIVDEFGNAIRYEYNNEGGALSKIIDTYNREILFDNGISYKDPESGETKRIDYKVETLDPSALENGSLLSGKDVLKLTVTNEAGEQTVYESRKTEGTASFTGYEMGNFQKARSLYEKTVTTTMGYNLERIVFPDGKQTHYEYSYFYHAMPETRVQKAIFVLSKRYDIEEGEQKNCVEYEFEEGHEHSITGVRADGRKNVVEFDAEGKRTSDYIYSKADEFLKGETYTYGVYDRVSMIRSSLGAMDNTTNYTYSSRYRVSSEYDDWKKTNYTYSELGNVPSKTAYSYKKSISYIDDFSIQTTKLEGTGKVEYEKVIKGGEIKAQTKYEYDESGNIACIYSWTKDTNGDGVLDFEDEYIKINGEYEVTDKKTLSYTSFADNLLNADGENEGKASLSYENNIFGSAILEKDSYGNETKVEYDELNRPVKIIMPNGGQRTVEYNTIEKYTILTDENGIKTKFIYDSFGNVKEKQRYHNGKYVTFEKYAYDSIGRVVTAIVMKTDDIGTETAYSYDELDRITDITVTDLSGNLLYTEKNTYKAGRSSYEISNQRTSPEGVSLACDIKRYDKYGNLEYEAKKTEDEEQFFEYTYDYLGRRLTSKDPNGNISTYTYDTAGNVLTETDAEGNVTSFSYDLAGRLISQTDAMGNTSKFYYDGLSRKIKEELPLDERTSVSKIYYDKNSNVIKQAVQNNSSENEESFKITEFKYDSMGNTIASIGRSEDGDSVVQYEYNKANQPIKMITGLSEYSENPTDGNVTSYEYTDGMLTKITDPLGQSETYTYDFLGNIDSKEDRNGNVFGYKYNVYGVTEYTTSEYNHMNDTWMLIGRITEYDSFGRVAKKAEYYDNMGTDEISYTYDSFGRLISETQENTKKEYTYDLNNNLTSYTLKENDEIKTQNTYTYNSLNQLTNQTIDDKMVIYQYNPVGSLISKKTGNMETLYEYNQGQLVTKVTNKNGENEYNSYSYTYSIDGTRIGEIGSDGVSKKYTYNNLGRLTEEVIKNNRTTYEKKYVYDANGNRIRSLYDNTRYEYDANNRLIREYEGDMFIIYTYDPNGNLCAKNGGMYSGEGTTDITIDEKGYRTSIYEYDIYNRLEGVVTDGVYTEYTYGADNLRKSKTVNGVTTGYVWNNENLVAETDGEAIRKIHSYTLDGITMTTDNGSDIFYLKNAHGDVTALTDSTGTITRNYQFDAFGNQLTQNIDDTNPFRYAGEYFDQESEMIYLRNRYYNTEIGRFITEDPIRDGLNWYVYCNNNPINFIDPLGLKIEIKGTSNQQSAMFEQLQLLTDDKLIFNSRTGNVSYKASDSVEREVATNLVRDIIDNDIKVGMIFNNEPMYKSIFGTATASKYDSKGDITVLDIYFDTEFTPGVWSYIENEGYQEVALPAFMCLGHELVHVIRRMTGVQREPHIKGYYVGGPQPGKTLLRVATPEELETSGIDYYKAIYGSLVSAKYVEASKFYYSENALRLEYDKVHKNDPGYMPMGKRVAY